MQSALRKIGRKDQSVETTCRFLICAMLQNTLVDVQISESHSESVVTSPMSFFSVSLCGFGSESEAHNIFTTSLVAKT